MSTNTNFNTVPGQLVHNINNIINNYTPPQTPSPVCKRSALKYYSQNSCANSPTINIQCTKYMEYEMDLLSQNHTDSNCYMSISNCGNCKTCHNLNQSHLYRSVITNRIYHTVIEDPSDNSLTCKSTNIVYLLTCNGCHIQYVGETRQPLHKRMNGHRQSISNHSGNKLIRLHFTENTSCMAAGFSTQIIHKLIGNGLLTSGQPDKDMDAVRKTLERNYMSSLRTCYPYGLNDRYNMTDLFNNISNINVFSLCFKPLENLNSSQYNTISINTPNSTDTHDNIMSQVDSPNNIIQYITNHCSCDKKPCMEMTSIIRYISYHTQKSKALDFIKLLIHKIHTTLDVTLNQQFLYMCLDMFNYKFNPHTHVTNPVIKTGPEFLLKLNFTHKIIEDINIESFIHSNSFTSLYPLQKTHTPTVVYTYLPPNGLSIFNYTEVFKNTNFTDFVNSFNQSMLNNPPCLCKNSIYKDPHHNHIITGNMDIIENTNLKKLFLLGPKHRTVPVLNIDKIYKQLVTDFKSCLQSWCRKSHMPESNFSACLNAYSFHCQTKLQAYQYLYSDHSNVSLKDQSMQTHLQDLHDKFVISPIDKAYSNIALTCKWYSIYITTKELGLLPGTSSTTYINLHSTESEVIQDIKDSFPITNFDLLDHEHETLPFIFPIPKLHKNPIKFRFITSSVNTFIKPALKATTQILRAVESQHKWYSDQLYSLTGIRHMWYCNKFQDVIDSIEVINKHHNATDTESYDFSTLYTTFDHSSMIQSINWCINKAFNDHNRKYVTFPALTMKDKLLLTSKPCYKYVFDINDSIKLHTWVVQNSYLKCGDITLIQRIGIPMGGDPAPYQANLSLHRHEFLFIQKLLRNKMYTIAKTFNNIHRFIDDINPKNNKGNFATYRNYIYPPGLIINKENTGSSSTSMLEIDMFIETNALQQSTFTTHLYDKRNDFGFPINKFPHISSNIHSRTVYNIFTTQVIRYSRVCNKLEYFLFHLRVLFTALIKKGCKKRTLLKKLLKLFVSKQITTKYKIRCDNQQLQYSLTKYLS